MDIESYLHHIYLATRRRYERNVVLRSLAEKPNFKRLRGIRSGKTYNDRKNGCQDRNYKNKLARATWQQSRDASGNCDGPFPSGTCNGHRYRTRVSRAAKRTVPRPAEL